ncbi:sulfotransferase [Thalassococcus sp. CAU 1522]|uniref:Sulfotransferase n=1 Tax=Thalassococcus arenae TaxID=2851652 RepID=A0ABS6N607_9RHOB|nr:sulfotransferase [Thalassococcus arenae]MBV2359444.1 sulfotransferase [Thalassococcus arenae]
MRIAMWSGPRNLSTAMMYAFGQRADCYVVDEPFYGPYLRRTGLAHPMRDAILASRPESADVVEQSLLGPIPDGKRHAYHKHMCQHMIPGMPLGCMEGSVNVFLIRHPARVAASYGARYDIADADALGFRRQAELFDHALSLGQSPVVVDSSDIRADPRRMLGLLCAAIGLDFDPAMLSWPKGGHPADGVWAAHWYRSVHDSTGFAGAEGALPELTGDIAAIAAEALPHYENLVDCKIG